MLIRTIHFEYTTGCNSRCMMCDYWKKDTHVVLQNEMVLSVVETLTPKGLRKIYFTGGECLIYAERLFEVCKQIRLSFPNLELGLITNGILLKKYYNEIGSLFSKVIISLDTVDSNKYEKIRGISALGIVQSGIHLLRKEYPQVKINLRALVLNETIEDIPAILDYAIEEQLHHVSFIPEDVSSRDAFGRCGMMPQRHNKDAEGFIQLFRMIDVVKSNYSLLFGTILPRACEDLEYIYAIYTENPKQCRKCNKASFSCVISASGIVSPCFFIRGSQALKQNETIEAVLESEKYHRMITTIMNGKYAECLTCACPKELS